MCCRIRIEKTHKINVMISRADEHRLSGSHVVSTAKTVALTDRPTALVHYGDACQCQSRVRTLQTNHRTDHRAGPLRTDRRSQRKSSPRSGCSALIAGESLLRVSKLRHHHHHALMTHTPGANSMTASTGRKHGRCCDRRLRADMAEQGDAFCVEIPASASFEVRLVRKSKSPLASQPIGTSSCRKSKYLTPLWGV